MKVVKWFLILLLFILAVGATVQNFDVLSKDVSFKLDLPLLPAWRTVPIPMGILFVMAVLFGGFFTGFVSLADIWRLRRKLRESKRRIDHLEQEVLSYRGRAISEAGTDVDREEY